MKPILCLGLLADRTFRHAIDAAQRNGRKVEVVDLAALIKGGVWQFHSDEKGIRLQFELDGRQIERSGDAPLLARIIWIDDGAPTPELAAAARQHTYLLESVLARWPGRVIFRPKGDGTNRSKIVHAELAKACGINVPDSLVTNQPNGALRFVEKHGDNVIYKGASAAKTIASAWHISDKARIPFLSKSPVLFQERIVGLDVRVHVVGEKVFPEAIYCDEIDYRFATNKRDTKHFAIEIPETIKNACVRLAQEVGSGLCGIDFKYDPIRDLWVFLECNSLPCFEGYDRRLKGEISKAVALFLSDPIVG